MTLSPDEQQRLARILARFPDVSPDVAGYRVVGATDVDTREAEVREAGDGSDQAADAPLHVRLTHLLDVDGQPRWVGYSEEHRTIVYGPHAEQGVRPDR